MDTTCRDFTVFLSVREEVPAPRRRKDRDTVGQQDPVIAQLSGDIKYTIMAAIRSKDMYLQIPMETIDLSSHSRPA